MLNEAIRLAKLGFAIHWLHPKSKRPIGDDWSTKPVMDADKLKAAYRNGNNVGLRLGEWSKVAGKFLHVIDMDIRDDDACDEALARLKQLFPAVETYPTVQSGSGGASRHFYVLCDKPFRSKKLAHSSDKLQSSDGSWHWLWEIELFGTGKQVAIPPSIHPDTSKAYLWLKPVEVDDILDDVLIPSVSADRLTELTGADERDDLPEDERQAPVGLSEQEIREVLRDLPASDWRDDRDGWLQVGFALHHETSGSQIGYDLWVEFSKGSEKFDKADQRRVWRSFKSSGVRKPLRMATLIQAARDARFNDALDDLDDLEDFAEPSEYDDLLGPSTAAAPKKSHEKLKKAEVEADLGHIPKKVQRLNKRHALAFVKGKAVVITEKKDGTVDFGTLSAMHDWYENDRVPTEKSTEPVSKMWVRHKHRREYPEGIDFMPGFDKEGYYNLWSGWTVEPSPEGSCQLWLDHLKNVICSGEERLFRYALGWFAHMVQKPMEKPGVAFVLRGKKGRGKDTIMDYFGGCCENHHVKVSNQDQMVGKFNAHQYKCLILHVEEGFWAGNKQAEGSLKHLITSEKVQIEPKGVDAFTVRSYLRLFLSSNEDWIVPATADERRFFVLDVSDARRGDHAYFARLRNEMNNGGKAALLHYLANVDLSNFQIRSVPDTAALGQQKLQGLKNIEKFWYDILDSAEMPCEFGIRDGSAGHWSKNAIFVDRDEFRDRYEQWLQRRRYEKNAEGAAIIGKKLNDMLLGNMKTIRRRIGNARNRTYVFPSLPECRDLFAKYLTSTVVWDEPVDEPDEDYSDI